MMTVSSTTLNSDDFVAVPQDGAREAADRAAFTEFYRAHVDFVWRNVRRLAGVDAPTDDIVQDVFVVAFRRLSRFEGRSSVKTWLFGILRNVVQDHRRALRRRGVRDSTDLDTIADVRGGSPHALVERAQALDTLYAVLASLDDAKREVFVLAELEQMTAPEIAEAIGATLTTVYKRLHDARREFEAAATRHRAQSKRTP